MPKKFRKPFIVLLVLIPVIVFLLSRVVDKSPEKEVAGEQGVQQPSMRKIAEGVWEMNGFEPIKQTIAKEKVDTNLKENPKAVEQAQKGESYRWSVKLPSGSVFAFGLQDTKGIKPVVKVTNKDGYFVRYYPLQAQSSKLKDQSQDQNSKVDNNETIEQFNHLAYVQPKVEKNVITWDISPGIKARYTMQADRVKADYIVQEREAIADGRLDFVVAYGGKGKTLLEEMPGGDLALFNEVNQEVFTIPAPVVTDKNKKDIPGVIYDLNPVETRDQSLLSIVIPESELDRVAWPLTIDPAVVDSTATSVATSYGNARHLVRDAYGNLVAFSNMNIVTGSPKEIFYKAYNATTWTNSGVYVINSGTSISDQIAGDIDSSGNIHVVSKGSAGNIFYNKLTLTRNSSNSLTGISAAAVALALTANGSQARPSIIIANKGGGAGIEKVAVAWVSNETGGGGGKRGEIRFLQCDITDDCMIDDNWKNADESQNANGACADGTSGLPDSVTCTGAADPIFNISNNATSHHGVITQIPGRPRRSPLSAYFYNGATYTSMANALDNNTSTNHSVSSIDNSDDYLYIGDTTQFSKASFDFIGVADGATLATLTVEYYNGATWAAVSNRTDNTNNGVSPFMEDGSLLFDEPSNWAQTNVNGDTKYWIRMRPTSSLTPVTNFEFREIYVTDRNARALMVIGGDAISQDLRAAYVTWDEINNDRWENNPASSSNAWRQDTGDTSSSVENQGAEWDTWSNFPLSATTDVINNHTYIGYLAGTDTTSGIATIKSVPNNKDVSVAANWTSTAFPTISEATDVVLSITSDGQDLYIFYGTNPGTNNLEWQRCRPQTAGLGNVCDHASDWNSATTFNVGTSANDTYPQAVVTKAFGDTVAIDVIFTNTTDTSILYERHFVDSTFRTITVSASGHDAYHRECASGGEDQVITETTVELGTDANDTGCSIGVHSRNHVGFLFPGVPVTQGAKIASAYVDFRVTSLTLGSPTFTIYGQDADSATPFSAFTDCSFSCSSPIGTRTRTTSSTTVIGGFMTRSYRFDVTDIVQEIVCRGAADAQPCVGDFTDISGNWSPQGNIALLLISSGFIGTDNFLLITAQDDTAAVTLDPTLQINLGQSGKDYSMGAATELPTGSGSYTNLGHPMASSSGELGAVLTDDSSYASVSATTTASQSAVPAFMFKVNNSNNANTDQIDVSAVVRSTASPSAKTIYLQVYRAGSTNNWVTVASNSTGYADSDITLTPSSITDAKDEYFHTNSPGGTCDATGTDCWTFWRIYQEAPTTLQNETLSVDYFNVTYTPDPPIEPRIRGPLRIRGNTRFR